MQLLIESEEGGRSFGAGVRGIGELPRRPSQLLLQPGSQEEAVGPLNYRAVSTLTPLTLTPLLWIITSVKPASGEQTIPSHLRYFHKTRVWESCSSCCLGPSLSTSPSSWGARCPIWGLSEAGIKRLACLFERKL